MKGSPIFPGFDHENNENTNYEFDAQTDFSQFLEEARKHAVQGKDSATVKCGQKQEVINNQEIKKSKKSWKNVLFPFWRSSSDKKIKTKPQLKETAIDSHAKMPKQRGQLSGPVVAAAVSSGRIRDRLSASGPLTSLFQAKKKENEMRIPYVSLEKLNKPAYDAKVYGPVYMVS